MVSHDEPSGCKISGLKIPKAHGAGRQSSGNRAGCFQPDPSEQHQPVEVIIFFSTRQLYWDCWEHLILRADFKKEREKEVGAAGVGLCCVLPLGLSFLPLGDPGPENGWCISILMTLVCACPMWSAPQPGNCDSSVRGEASSLRLL